MAKVYKNSKIRKALLRLLVILDDEGYNNSTFANLLWEVYVDRPIVICVQRGEMCTTVTVSPDIPHEVVFESVV